MKILAAFFSLLYGTPMAILVEDLHARFIGDWLKKPTPDCVHPNCTWTLGEGHPHKNTFTGDNFFGWYSSQLTDSFGGWKQVVSEVIGSPIGAIVVGRFHVKNKENGYCYSAPFTHFYRIRQGKIINAQYFMGDMNKSTYPVHELIDIFPADSLPSLN